jgi:hypothetical protein
MCDIYIFSKHLDSTFDQYVYIYIDGYTFWDLGDVYMCFVFCLMMSNLCVVIDY